MQDDFHLNEWAVKPQLNSISANGKTIRLEPKVMEVLVCLAGRAGEVVSKESIIQQVWSDRFVTDEVLTTAVFQLRKALGDEARNPRFIQTISKKGYRLIATVSFERAPSNDGEGNSALARLRRWRKPLVAAAAFGLLIAAAVLKIGLLTSKENRRAPQQNAEAYGEYLKGRNLQNDRTEEGLKRAIAHFERAVELDASFALAYSSLADFHHLLASHNYLRPEEGYPRAKEAALKAIELDDRSAQAHAALAISLLVYDWNWVEAESHFKKALSLDENCAQAHNLYAQYLWAAGRLDEALIEAKRARELDPASISAHMTAGDLLFRLRRYDEAMEAYQSALAVNPTYWLAYKAIGHVYHRKSMINEAEAAYRKAAELSGLPSFAQMSRGLINWSKTGDARFLLNKMSVMLKQKYVRPTHIARLYLDLGDKAQALEWLERAYLERDSILLFLKTEEGWEPISSDQRFVDLLNRIGPTS
jgi:DNA-binding winged helix-turn-helix (wHTH) protein